MTKSSKSQSLYVNVNVNEFATTIATAVTTAVLEALQSQSRKTPETKGTAKNKSSKNSKVQESQKSKTSGTKKTKSSSKSESKTQSGKAPSWMADKPSKKDIKNLKEALDIISNALACKTGKSYNLKSEDSKGTFTITANSKLDVKAQRAATWKIASAVKTVGFDRHDLTPDETKESKNKRYSYSIDSRIWDAAKKIANA